MTYATQQDMVDRFGSDELIQLTDRTNIGAIDSTVVSRALGDADAEINGYLAAQYSLPLDTTPAVLVRLACDIARYQLSADRVTEAVRDRYKDAVAMLRSLARGEAQLGVATGQAPTPTDSGIAYTAPERVFSGSTLRDY
jgi:phage gp36-like protein